MSAAVRPRRRWSSWEALSVSQRWLWAGYRPASRNQDAVRKTPPALARMSRRRSSSTAALAPKICRHSSPEPSSLLDDEDLLEEILLRLPPQPSSLPRASLGCKRWRSILSNSQFFIRFRRHPHKPPLLGFFTTNFCRNLAFTSLLDPPDRIPSERFSSPSLSVQGDFLGCRRGLAVLINNYQHVVLLWDPLTDQLRCVPFPTRLVTEQRCNSYGAVLCTHDRDVHIHDNCFSSLFKFVLICSTYTHVSACVYESSSGVWGKIVSTTTNNSDSGLKSSIIIGNAIYSLFIGGDILVFDSETHTLGVIDKPANTHPTNYWSFQLLRIDDDDDSSLGLAVMSRLTIQFWKKKSNYDGVVEWVLLPKIIQLDGLFPQGIDSFFKETYMVGYDEDSNVIVLATYFGDFMVHIESMRFTRFSTRNHWDINMHYPYRIFYTAGI